LRAGLDRVIGGTGACNIAFIQDSLGIGFDGTVGDPNGGFNLNFAFPSAFRDSLNALGYTTGGPGTMCTTVNPSAMAANYGFSWTGGVAPLNYFLFTATGGTITWVSPKACTHIDIAYSNQNSNFSYTVDGGAPNNVVPTGAATNAKLTVPGVPLANVVHTVVITCGATHALTAINGYSLTGLMTHNLSQGGTTIAWAAGGPNINWGDTSVSTNLPGARIAALPANLDAVFFMMGANDKLHLIDPATIVAGAETFLNTRFPGVLAGTTDVILGTSYHIPPSNPASDSNWEQTLNLYYQLAARRNWRLFDWNDRLGGVGQALLNNLLGADSTHPIWGVSVQYGKSLSNNLVL